MNDDLAAIAEALDLPADADRETILGAVEELKVNALCMGVEIAHRLDLDAGSATSRDVLNALDVVMQAAAEAPVAKLLAAAIQDGRIDAAHEGWWREQLEKHFEGARDALLNMPPGVYNRRPFGTPPEDQ